MHPHVDYKIWADSYYSLRTSLEARAETEWHLAGLRNLGTHRKAIFPPMKPPVPGFIHHEVAEVDGLLHQFDAPDFYALRKQYRNISHPIVLKSAHALLNVHITSHTHALFSNLEAARTTFPFIPKALHTPGDFEATDVSGPCFESVINLIEIRPDEKVIEFIQRMQDEQNNLTTYASAPWSEIMKALGPEDGKIMPEMVRTQVFNRVPGMGTTGTNPNQHFEMLVAAVRPAVGLAVNAGMGGPEGLTVFMHLRGTYVDEEREKTLIHARKLEKTTQWIMREENWEAEVGGFAGCLNGM